MSNVNKQLIVNKPLPIYKAGIKKTYQKYFKTTSTPQYTSRRKVKTG